MKKTLSYLMAAITLFTTATGCSSSESASPASEAVVIVLNATAASPQIAPALYSDEVYNAMFTYGEVAAVIADGDPNVELHVKNTEPDIRIDTAKRKQLAQQYSSAVLKEIAAASAKEEEVNTLDAIHEAARVLQGSDMTAKKMVIISSGLDTAGYLDFSASNLLDADPAFIIEELEKRHAIPDLSDLEVTVIGLGETAGVQTALDTASTAKLIGIWEAILTEGNPATLNIVSTPLQDIDPVEGLPHCSTVSVVAESIKLSTTTVEEPSVIRLDEQSVAFTPNTSDFADEAAVQDSLTPILEYLSRNSSEQVLIAGMTASASGSTDEHKALSEARANAVKEALVALGAEEEQICTIGLGCSNNPLRVCDLDSSGKLIEEAAKQNRAVFVVFNDDMIANLMEV